MATIRDVAKLAGVSIASVSRIMNGDENYKTTEKTRQAVMQAIAELNYYPSESYSRNRKKVVKKRIGCITNMTVERTMDAYYTRILSGIEKELNRREYGFAFLKSQYDLEDEKEVDELLKTPPKGLILMSTPPPEVYKKLCAAVPHIVGVDTTLTDIDNVRYNRFETGCRAMQYLLEKGHRKIGFIGTIDASRTDLKFGRFEAYKYMLMQAGLKFNPEYVVNCLWQQKVCFDATGALMRREDRPTAFFAASDHMAIAAMSAIFQEDLRIPDDISIVSISNIDESQYTNPPLTTMAIPQLDIGQIVAQTLLKRIDGDTGIPKQIYVPTRLIERSSVREI